MEKVKEREGERAKEKEKERNEKQIMERSTNTIYNDNCEDIAFIANLVLEFLLLNNRHTHTHTNVHNERRNEITMKKESEWKTIYCVSFH